MDTLYLWFRKAAIEEFTEEYTEKIMKKYGLCYRTVKALTKIINNESGITKYHIETLLNPEFYTLDNMIKVAELGLTDIIPYKFYEDEEFLTKTGITRLPNGFLTGNTEIEEFTVMPQITGIGDEVFMGCTNLRTIVFRGAVTYIGARAFKDCTCYQIEKLPDSVTYIGSGAYKNCYSIKRFYLPAGVTEIKDRTFQNCTGLEEFYAGSSSLTGYTANHLSVGDRAFYGCEKLYRMEAVVTELGEESFKDCVRMIKIIMKVAIIPRRAFYGCTRLEEVAFVENCIPVRMKKDAFYGCDGLSKVTVDGFSYQLREAEGYRELTKNFYIINRKTKVVLSCDMVFSRKVGNVLQAAGR